MSRTAWVALCAFLAGASVAYVYEGQRTAAARAEADVYAEQLDSALARLEVSEAAQADKDSASAANDARALAEIAASDRRRVAAEARARAAEARQGEVISGIAERAGPDSAVARAAAQEATDSVMANVVVPLRLAAVEDSLIKADLRTQIAARDAQIATRDRVQADLREALAASQAEAGALRDALPGWLSRNGPKLAVPVAMGVGWYLRGLVEG